MPGSRPSLLIGAALLLAGCATAGGPGCADYTDPTTAATYRWCGDAQAFGDATPLRPATELVSILPVEERIGDARSYFLRVRYQGEGWLYMQPGTTLRLDVDGQPVELSSARGSRADSARLLQDRWGQTYQEAADFGTDAATLERLASAGVVDFVLTTGGRQVEGRLGGGSLVPFREFARTWMAP